MFVVGIVYAYLADCYENDSSSSNYSLVLQQSIQ